MITIQVIGLFVSIVFMYFTNLYHKKNTFSTKEYAYWMMIWLALLFASVFPDLLAQIVQPLSFIRMMDMLLVLSIMNIFVILFYLHNKMSTMQGKIERIVMKLAIK